MSGTGEFWIGDGPDLRPPSGPDRGLAWLVAALVVAAVVLAVVTS